MRIFGQCLNLNARLPLECPPSAQPCHPTALRDFEGAFVGCGSIASHPDVRDAPGMSAMPPIATQSVRRNEASRCANTGRRTERVGLSRLKSLSKQSRTRCIASAVSSHADVGEAV